MRAIVVCAVVLCACSGRQPPPPPLFDPLPSIDKEVPINLDLKAIEKGNFQIKLGPQTLTLQHKLKPDPIFDGTVFHGPFVGGGDIVLALVGTKVSGVIRLGTRGFEIMPTATGHILVPRSWTNPRPLHDGPSRRGALPPPTPISNATVEITVLFAYTPSVLAKRTLDGIKTHIATAMQQLEQACQADKLKVRFKALDPIKTESVEGIRTIHHLYDALYDKTDFKDAHDARKTAEADILILLVDRPDGALGLATIMGEPETAVAVADQRDSLWYLTIPHEIGHIMGGLHDDDLADEPFAYGHGFLGDTSRTIMSNKCKPPEKCELLVRWSAPPDRGNKDWNHDARVIREMAAFVAKFSDQL